MNRWRWINSALAFVLVALASRSARADFTCPGGFTAYEVYSASTWQTGGVRCVGFFDKTDPRTFQWYGEGQWGGWGSYRHIGSTLTGHQDPSVWYQWDGASATDIYGNGETSYYHSENLTIITSTNPGAWDGVTPPWEIRVTGDWNEVWFSTGSDKLAGYNSPAPPITNCEGHNVQKYLLWIAAPGSDTYWDRNPVCLWEDPFYGPAIRTDLSRMMIANGWEYAWSPVYNALGTSDFGRTNGSSCEQGWEMSPEYPCAQSSSFLFQYIY